MGKRLPYTPTSIIKNGLRQIWLRSRERAAALKAANYICEQCGAKQSTAKGREVKVEVHHKNGIEAWNRIITAIRIDLLPDKTELEVLCKECHHKLHQEEEK